MAVDDDRIESDHDNMDVAFQRAIEKMVEISDKELASPALTAAVETLMDTLRKNPMMAVISAFDDLLTGTIEVAILHAVLMGIEWGKTGRDLYMFPATEGCEDPTHHHHRSRLN